MTRPGRPKLKPDERKSVRLELRITEAERDAFEAAAEREGVTLSEWIRAAASRAAERRSR